MVECARQTRLLTEKPTLHPIWVRVGFFYFLTILQMTVKHLEDGKAEHREAYEWKTGSVNVAGTAAGSALTGVASFTTLFDTVPRAHKIRVTVNTGTLYMRLNGTLSDAIQVTASTPFEEEMVVKSIHVSTGGTAIAVTVRLH